MSQDAVSRAEADDIDGKTITVNDQDDSKEDISSLSGVNDVAAIPKGTIDPVYEAKARILNHAVCFH